MKWNGTQKKRTIKKFQSLELSRPKVPDIGTFLKKTSNHWNFLFCTFCVLVLVSSAGCATRERCIIDAKTLSQKAETKCKDNICVSVAPLSPDEIQSHFGYPLFEAGVTPVWVKIDNPTDYYLWMMTVYADPDYYDPSEIAIKFRHLMTHADEEQCQNVTETESLTDVVVPHSTTSGFIYTEKTDGARILPIVLLGQDGLHSYFFHLRGFKRFDHDHIDTELEQPYDHTDAQTSEQLRSLLATIPPRTTNAGGKKQGDPINFFLIGSRHLVLETLATSDWDETEPLTLTSAWSTFTAFFTKKYYNHSPVSSLYLFDRKQDTAFQKVRDTIHARNHLRLWRTPFTYQNTPIWAGQISRDIGIRFTTATPNLTTHIIDPDIDAARWYLIQDFIRSQHVRKVEFVRAGHPISRNNPEKNTTGDPFYTDGMQALLFLSEKPIATDELEIGDWKKASRRKHIEE